MWLPVLLLALNAVSSAFATYLPYNQTSALHPACRKIRKMQQEYPGNPRKIPPIKVDIHTIYNCVGSIRLNRTRTLDFLENLKVYFSFQSDLEFIKDPPLQGINDFIRPMDVLGELERTKEKIRSGQLVGQWDMEASLRRIIAGVRDGHVDLDFGLMNAWYIRRNASLVAFSQTSQSDPHYYIAGPKGAVLADLLPDGEVISIDGVPIEKALVDLSAFDVFGFRGVDASVNQMFFNFGDAFRTPAKERMAYMSQRTNRLLRLTGRDGSTTHVESFGCWTTDLRKIGWEDQLYEQMVGTGGITKRVQTLDVAFDAQGRGYEDVENPVERVVSLKGYEITPDLQRIHSRAHTTAKTPDATGSSSAQPWESDFRVPENERSFRFYKVTRDLAVLRIRNFERTLSKDMLQFLFEKELREFEKECALTTTRNLIVDLRGNPGGWTPMPSIIFGSLFRNKSHIELGQRTRRSPAVDFILRAFASPPEHSELQPEVHHAVNPYRITLWSWPNGVGVEDVEELLASESGQARNMTAYVLSKITDAWFPQEGAPQFSVDRVFILVDGICSSGCAQFFLLCQRAGVKSIFVGGRSSAVNEKPNCMGGTANGYCCSFNDLRQAAEGATQLSNAIGGNQINRVGLPKPLNIDVFGSVSTWSWYLNESSTVPAHHQQFPPDLRLHYTNESLHNDTKLWLDVASVAFHDHAAPQADLA